MKNQKIVSDLIRGMNNLSRMREEIDQIVSGLISVGTKRRILPPTLDNMPPLVRLITSITDGVNRSGFVFKSDSYAWRIHVVDGRYVITCMSINEGLLVYYSRKHDELSLENIEAVYDALPILIEGMFEKFPKLLEAAAPVLSAAKKFADE